MGSHAPQFFKLNTNGSSLDNPIKASASGFIRNHFGECIGGFYRNLGNALNTAAELWALRDELMLTQSMNTTNLLIEFDREVNIDMINNSKTNTHEFSPIIYDYRTIM